MADDDGLSRLVGREQSTQLRRDVRRALRRGKPPAVLDGYIRAAEQWTKRGLEDVGF